MNVVVDVGTALKNLVLSGWRMMMVGDVDTALKKTSASDVDTALKKSLCGRKMVMVSDGE